MFYFLSSLLFALETWINKNLLASQVFATYLWKQDLKKKKENIWRSDTSWFDLSNRKVSKAAVQFLFALLSNHRSSGQADLHLPFDRHVFLQIEAIYLDLSYDICCRCA